jgi:transcriptional regulator with XRE-family HTH domain
MDMKEKLLASLNPLTRSRIRLNLTQDDLSKRARITTGYVARVELGKSRPSVSVALRIAEAVGEDVATLFPKGCVARVEHRVARVGMDPAAE